MDCTEPLTALQRTRLRANAMIKGEQIPSMPQEVIDAAELAQRWRVSRKWVFNHSRPGYANDPIPHVKLGRHVRYDWGSPQLAAWWSRRQQ